MNFAQLLLCFVDSKRDEILFERTCHILSPTEYFGAAQSSLQRLLDDPDPSHGRFIDSLVSVLQFSIGRVRPAVLRTKRDVAADVVVRAVGRGGLADETVATGLRCLGKVLEFAGKDTPWDELGKRLLGVLVGFMACPTAKVKALLEMLVQKCGLETRYEYSEDHGGEGKEKRGGWVRRNQVSIINRQPLQVLSNSSRSEAGSQKQGGPYTGKEYTSRKARCDAERKDKLEPYAYWPLDCNMMSRRPEHRAAARKGMASVVRMTKSLEGQSAWVALSLKGSNSKRNAKRAVKKSK
ncbi:hypothetical protein MLD38_005868 [Melastoma candidum]|uniref:Uncharacterized protein n=1 Tax=Melastoma candidum TaxID=119954 RepID=A0ACB9RKS9_9MYRT|nr:hypothetical protein MLD38_005868 [Melastoma candidum]